MRLIRNRSRLSIIGATILSTVLACTAIAAADTGGFSSNDSSRTLYSSVLSPFSATNLPHEWWSLSFGGTNATQLGDKINLSSPAHLRSATVMLDSQALGVGTFPVAVTFTFYLPGATGGSVGAVLATQTKTFDVPYRPAGNATACGANTASIFPYTTNDGSQWLDPATGSCYYGVVYPATFNFSPSVALPSTVVNGIPYNATSGPASSMNVLFSTETPGGAVATGSDTDPGNLFVQAGTGSNALGGSGGQITCSTVSGGFSEYNTAVGATGCGTDTQQGAGAPFEPIGFVPAVIINGR